MEIGIRELRNRLSRHPAEVRAGRVIPITDHGQPIARIVPIDRPTRLEALIAEGRIRPLSAASSRRVSQSTRVVR